MIHRRALIIDDEPMIGEIIADIAEEMDFDTSVLTDPIALDEHYNQFMPSVLFVDLAMPGFDGIQTLDLIHKLGCHADIFIISGHDNRVLNAARDYGISKGLKITGTLSKPIEREAIELALSSINTDKPALHNPLGKENFTLEEVIQGLSRNEFYPRFQPKVYLKGVIPKIIGAEALVRWRHPIHGELPPVKFLPLIESENLTAMMTECLIRNVIEHLCQWKSDHCEPHISINLSPSMLNDLSLPDYYESLINNAGLSTSSIIFEITESAAMEDVSVTTKILTRFRLKGFGLSIDDFGTGFSSLVELYRMPFSELKIDKMFVCNALQDKEADVIVKLLIQLAQSLGISVCAEGAEDKDTLNYLKSLACDLVQGYTIAKPLLPDEFIKMFKSYNN
ncbi:EAL domain-containing protein [Thalassotalea ganghwensis]